MQTVIGVRVRSVTEYCPMCQAKSGEPCWEMVRLRLTGKMQPIRNRSSFHHIDIYQSEY